MTSVPRVLIVDDQKEVVRLLQSAIESTGHEIEVVGAPSGEEALLEAMQKPIDLLVVDYMLPGISGIELLTKLRKRSPELQGIFITGQMARSVHREIMNADVQAFFVKPVPMGDFLDAVERCLGLASAILPPDVYAATNIENPENLASLLSDFRQQENAHAIILLDEQGMVVMQAGSLPDSSQESLLYATLTSIQSHGNKVMDIFSQTDASQLFVFRQAGYDLLAVPVTRRHLLVVAGEDFAAAERLSVFWVALHSLRDEVRELMYELGLYDDNMQQAVEESAREAVKAESRTDQISLDDDEPIAEDLLELLENASANVPDPNAFWEDAIAEHTPQPFSADVINYDQALQLGLAPEDDEELD